MASVIINPDGTNVVTVPDAPIPQDSACTRAAAALAEQVPLDTPVVQQSSSKGN